MFFSTPDLRAPSADRRETSPHDGKLTEVKNSGAPPPTKKLGPKTCKISVDFCNVRLWSRISPEQIDISQIGEKNSYNFGTILTKLFPDNVTRGKGDNWLLESPPSKFWESQKTSKFRHDFWQLSNLIANISGKDPHIENRRQNRSTTTPSTLGDKNLVNFGPQTTEIQWCFYWPTQMDFFRETIFRPLRGATSSNFYTC